jgi:hypothetical protein
MLPLKIIKFIPYILIINLVGCKYDKGKISPTLSNSSTLNSTNSDSCTVFSSISYSVQVQPILNAYCVSCHDASAGISLDNYSSTKQFALSGQLKGALTGNANYLKMPPFTNLDSCQIRTIVSWINQGDTNN